TVALVRDGAIARVERSIDFHRIPLLRMADVVQLEIVVLAPEKRYRIEPDALAEDVLRCNLALTLGNHPVLNANALTRMRIWPARNIARRINALRAGLQVFVDRDAAIERQSGLLGQRDRRAHADTHDDEVGRQRRAVAQRHLPSVDAGNRLAEMKHDAV